MSEYPLPPLRLSCRASDDDYPGVVARLSPTLRLAVSMNADRYSLHTRVNPAEGWGPVDGNSPATLAGIVEVAGFVPGLRQLAETLPPEPWRALPEFTMRRAEQVAGFRRGSVTPKAARLLAERAAILRGEAAAKLSPAKPKAGPVTRAFLPDGRSIVDAARTAGLAVQTLRGRLANGWSVEDALSVPVGVKRPVMRKLPDGKPVARAAREAGLPMSTLRGRLARGWSPGDALSVPAGQRRKRPPASGTDENPGLITETHENKYNGRNNVKAQTKLEERL